MRTKQQQTPQQVVNGRVINYNVMYATLRCDKKRRETGTQRVLHAVRTDRGEMKTSFYPGFYQTSVEEKGVEVIREI